AQSSTWAASKLTLMNLPVSLITFAVAGLTLGQARFGDACHDSPIRPAENALRRHYASRFAALGRIEPAGSQLGRLFALARRPNDFCLGRFIRTGEVVHPRLSGRRSAAARDVRSQARRAG